MPSLRYPVLASRAPNSAAHLLCREMLPTIFDSDNLDSALASDGPNLPKFGLGKVAAHPCECDGGIGFNLCTLIQNSTQN